jgi:predicted amidohydrolase
MLTGLVQYNPVWENKEKNKEKIISLLSNSEKTDLLVFPEMTLTGFTMKSSEFAEDIEGDSIYFFKKIAVDYNTNVIAGYIERDNTKIYNTLVHIDRKGQELSSYRKMHPFSCSGEDKNFVRGTEIKTTMIDGWKTGLSICFDLRFPELYRYYAIDKVAMIINIASWPETRIEHWKTLLKARAIENQCFVIGVNRVGTDPTLNYTGCSNIIDPMGKEIFGLINEERIITADLTLNRTEEVRTKLPFLNDICLLK